MTTKNPYRQSLKRDEQTCYILGSPLQMGRGLHRGGTGIMAAEPNYDLLYELSRDQLSSQLSFADAIDAKISGAFGISAALAGVLAAMVALRQALAQ
jgi:hypothetical protein